jgi:hypothetical protein
MADMRDTFSETKRALEKSLSENTLSPEQRQIVLEAMMFGYSAAYCSRTSDMQGGFFGAQEYENGYNRIREELEA